MLTIGNLPIYAGVAGLCLMVAAAVQAAEQHPPADDHSQMAKKPAAEGHEPGKKPMALVPKQATKTPVKPKTKPDMHDAGPKASGHARKARTPQSAPMKSPPRSGTAHWAYAGNTGPDHWGRLSESYHACGTGQHQSPVNIEAVEPARLLPLSFHYKVSLIEMVNNGHTVQANYGKGSHIMLGDRRYDLVQFHFHTPSEHTIAGRAFPMEIQFVHRHKSGQLVMVGLLATTGKSNLAAQELWDRLPAKAHTRSADTRALINARDLLPDNSAYFRYRGSLTTPPCTENVEWLVLRTPVAFSESQIAKINGIMGANARPAQARNGRYFLQSIGG